MPNAAIPVRIINLKRSPDRRAHMEKELQGRGLRYQFFEATDGQACALSESAHFDKKRAAKWPLSLYSSYSSNDLTNNMNACSYSHLRLYQWMVKANIQRALVMEDDIFLSDHFFTALNTFETWAPKGWDVINFYTTCWPFLPVPNQHLRVGLALYALPALPTYSVVRCVRRTRMGACYLITLKAAKHLLKIGYPVRMPGDLLHGTLDLSLLNLYTLFPDLIRTFELASARHEPDAQTSPIPPPTKRAILYTVWREICYHLYLISLCCQMALRHKGARKHFSIHTIKLIAYTFKESLWTIKKTCIAHVGLAKLKRYRDFIPKKWRHFLRLG